MPFLALDAVSRRLSEIKRGVTVFRGYLAGAVFQPAVFIVGEVQHFPVDERHAVHDDVTMNVMADNIFALIFLNIMEIVYQKQREKLLALNAKNTLQSVTNYNILRAKKAMQKKFEELEFNMMTFEFMLCGNLNIADKGAFFESNEGYIIFLEDKKSIIYCGLNESLEPLVEGFDAYLNASNTNIYVCKNCKGLYFNTEDRGYCSKPICQQIKRLTYKRQNRESRKQDVYRNLMPQTRCLPQSD